MAASPLPTEAVPDFTTAMEREPVRILLDFGFVLTGPQDPRVFDSLLRDFGLSRPAFLSAWALRRREYDGGLLDETAYWRLTLEACGLADARNLADRRLEELVAADFAAWSSPRTEVHALIAHCMDRGVEFGILSNMPRGRGACYVEAWPWLERIPHRLFSGDEGLTKPDPAIYLLYLKRSGWKPAETLFVDDSAENIAAAEALGFAVHHFIEEKPALETIRNWTL